MKKKLMALLLVVATMSVALVGCKKKTECALCGDVEKCEKYKGDYYCSECYEGLKAIEGIGNMLGF